MRGESELAIMSRKFEFLRPKSGREMLIGQFDQVMTYHTFRADLHGMNTNKNGGQR